MAAVRELIQLKAIKFTNFIIPLHYFSVSLEIHSSLLLTVYQGKLASIIALQSSILN